MKNWNEIQRASTDQILAWAEAQPWAKAMAVCQQDAEWHAEGDVWTHTLMMLEGLRRGLSRQSQSGYSFRDIAVVAGNGRAVAG